MLVALAAATAAVRRTACPPADAPFNPVRVDDRQREQSLRVASKVTLTGAGVPQLDGEYAWLAGHYFKLG